jgi:hypothetical protein
VMAASLTLGLAWWWPNTSTSYNSPAAIDEEEAAKPPVPRLERHLQGGGRGATGTLAARNLV